MNSVLHGTRRLLRCFLIALAGLLLATLEQADALDILRLDKSVDRTQASIASGEIIRFRIRYNCASTSDSAVSAVISDVLDPGFELISMQGSAHTTSADYDPATFTVRFTFVTPLVAGSTGELFIQARFKIATPVNTVANNVAVFSAGNSDPQTSNQVSITAVDPPSGGGLPPPPLPPRFVPGLAVEKFGPSSITPIGPYLVYEIRHGNTGDTADPLTSYSIEDPLPPGTSLQYFGTERWGETGVPVTVYYKSNLLNMWRQWGTGARYNTGDSRKWIYADELFLLPNEWVTALRFDYGTLPGGGAFLPGSMSNNLQIVAFMRNPATFTPGADIVNCATVSSSGYTQTSCVNTKVLASQPQPYLDVEVSGAHSEPFAIGETFLAQTHLGVGESSSTGMDDPVICMLLPPELNFKSWRMRWWAAGSLNTPPDFSKVTNFGAPNQTLLIWSWLHGKPMNLPANRTWNELMVEADVEVNSRTPSGEYKVSTWAGWRAPGMDVGTQSYTNDSLDVDRDGDVAERLATDYTYVTVSTGNGVAGLESTMFVRGELDTVWTRFPFVGRTVTGGRADYELHVRNIGGIVMRDAIIVDILPIVGDTGVIDPSPRGSQWAPFLADAVAAPAGVTVFYSASSKPCRPELVPSGPPGCEDPKWSSAIPEDITTVHSLKFDLTGLEMFPGDEIVLTWPMRAPWDAPTNGEVAWNSFGYTATRSDNGGSLLASEPVKTGIAIQKPVPPYYGDRVWLDADKDGNQDGTEKGINGVRVELFRDNGDNIANPATDTFVTFTATYRENGKDGTYLFGNMGAGSYFAVVVAPSETGVTLANKAADGADSDGTSFIYKNRRAAITPVTKLDPLEEDRSWDQGFYNRSGIPSVWAVAHTADGRMVIGGKFARSHGVARNNIARLTSTGAVDSSFNPGTGFDGPVRSVAIRSDGLIWAGGNFGKYNGKGSKGVALLSPAGVFDSRPARPDTNEVNWVAANGTRMYLAGAFGKVGGIPCGNVARLNADGTVDTSFIQGAGANGTIFSGSVQTDGSLLLAGAFSTFNGVSRKGIVKLKPDGSVDPNFNPQAGASGEVYSLKVFEDGRMALTGNFRSFDGTACNGTIRLLKTGRVDTSMTSSSLNVDSINSSN